MRVAILNNLLLTHDVLGIIQVRDILVVPTPRKMYSVGILLRHVDSRVEASSRIGLNHQVLHRDDGRGLLLDIDERGVVLSIIALISLL